MTKAESARLGGLAKAASRLPYRERFLQAVAAGEGAKRAAFDVGISERSARRYLADAR